MRKLFTLIAISATILMLNACAKEEAAPAPEAAAPVAATPAPAAEPSPAKEEAGGYVPSETERVPGVSIDPSKLAEEEKAAIDAAQKAADAIQASVTATE